MAAQRFRAAETTGRPRSDKPKYLTLWEAEGASAAAIDSTLKQARKNAADDEKNAEIVYWEPITPYITRDDFQR
jgi:hypothetical protein